MKDRKRVITQKGLDKLKNELNHRKVVLRKEIADKLDEAKAIGDLSENSAYTAALEDYQLNESKIKELTEQISSFVVAPDRTGDSKIDIGDKVRVKDLKSGKEIIFSIVGIGEGDPTSGRISSDSAVGKALTGKTVGDKIKVDLPVGQNEYEILELI
ncbi:MAG: transcription elongation factor GreA [Candidatus Dojkabacteria bacterium]|nr:transcription elongation factor GreA [Candidatus Dojkabacteria bacterium]